MRNNKFVDETNYERANATFCALVLSVSPNDLSIHATFPTGGTCALRLTVGARASLLVFLTFKYKPYGVAPPSGGRSRRGHSFLLSFFFDGWARETSYPPFYISLFICISNLMNQCNNT